MDIKKNLELKRKLFHLLFGILVMFGIYSDSLNAIDVFFLLVISVAFFFFYKTRKVKFIDFFVQHFERPDTTHIGIGIINFLLGVLLALVFFEKNISLGAISVLVIGDSISPIVGMHFGRIKIEMLSKKKMVEGVVAGIILSILVGSLFVPVEHMVVAATIGMIVEMVELKNKIDDNILVPVVAGTILLLLSLL